MSFNYIGSKKSLINFLDIPISKIISSFNNNDNANKVQNDKITMLDGFAGTGIVGFSFYNKYDNLKIISNDLEYYSYIINYALMCVPYTDNIKNMIEYINKKLENVKEKPDYDLVSKNYTLLGPDKRMFWTEENGKVCDYCIYLFDKLLNNNTITKSEYVFLYASLLSAMDKVANTASVYGAFLKSFKSSAKEKIKLSPIHICNNNTLRNNKVFNNDINSDKILNQTYDIAYLDPPYNQRQYSANYHPLNYIANYDSSLEIYGKTGLLKISNKSKYSQKSNAFDTLKHLITNLNAKHILLSYNNEGIIEFNKIKELLISQGKVILYKKLYKKFKSNEIQENENVYEYLFHLEKINNNSTYDEVIV